MISVTSNIIAVKGSQVVQQKSVHLSLGDQEFEFRQCYSHSVRESIAKLAMLSGWEGWHTVPPRQSQQH